MSSTLDLFKKAQIQGPASQKMKSSPYSVSDPSRVDPKVLKFPSDPSKVYRKEAPKGFADEVRTNEDTPHLVDVDPQMNVLAEKVNHMAKYLRNFYDDLYNPMKKKLLAEVNEKLQKEKDYRHITQREQALEEMVNTLGNNLLPRLGATGVSVYRLINERILFVIHKVQNTKLEPTDKQRYDALLAAMKEKLSDKTVNDIEKNAQKLLELEPTFTQACQSFVGTSPETEYKQKEINSIKSYIKSQNTYQPIDYIMPIVQEYYGVCHTLLRDLIVFQNEVMSLSVNTQAPAQMKAANKE